MSTCSTSTSCTTRKQTSRATLFLRVRVHAISKCGWVHVHTFDVLVHTAIAAQRVATRLQRPCTSFFITHSYKGVHNTYILHTYLRTYIQAPHQYGWIERPCHYINTPKRGRCNKVWDNPIAFIEAGCLMYIRGDHRIFESYKSLVVSSWNYKSLVVISWNYSFVNLQIVLKRQLWSCPWPSCNFMKLQCNFMTLHCNFMKLHCNFMKLRCNFMKLRCNFMKLQFRELTTCITPSKLKCDHT